MKASKTLKCVLTAVACLALAVPAKGVIAFDYPLGLEDNMTGNSAAVGMVFTVNSGFGAIVTSLGVFDYNADGINTVHPITVAIYSVSMSGNTITGGSLAVDPYTFSGTSDSLLSGTSTRAHGVSEVWLVPGTYMVVANNYAAASPNYEGGFDYSKNHGATVPSANPISPYPGSVSYFLGGFRSSDNPASWVTSLPGTWDFVDSGYAPNYGAGNFEFTPVPEASQFAVAGVGLLGLVYIGRCAYQRRKGVA